MSDSEENNAASLQAIQKRLEDQEAKMFTQEETIKEQQRLLAELNNDQSNVQAGQLLARDQLRQNQKEIELRKHDSPDIKRNLGLLFNLQFLTNDAIETWEGIAPSLSEIQNVDKLKDNMITEENMTMANRALESNMFILADLSDRIKKEIFYNESASIAPMKFGIISTLEGKSSKFSGDTKEDQESLAAKFQAGVKEYYKDHPKGRGRGNANHKRSKSLHF